MKPSSINFSKNRDQLVLYFWSLGFRYCLGFRYYNLEFPKIRCWRIYGFMQNEPNFQCSRSKLNAVIADSYNKISLVNQKITNPIEPNTNPIGKPPKINANFFHNRELQRKTSFAPKNNEPNRTQTEPNRTQTEPNTNPKTNPIWIYPLHRLAFLLLDRYIVDRWSVIPARKHAG